MSSGIVPTSNQQQPSSPFLSFRTMYLFLSAPSAILSLLLLLLSTPLEARTTVTTTSYASALATLSKTTTITPTITHTLSVKYINVKKKSTSHKPSAKTTMRKPVQTGVVFTRQPSSTLKSSKRVTITSIQRIGTVTASPSTCSPFTECADAINSCGIRYGVGLLHAVLRVLRL